MIQTEVDWGTPERVRVEVTPRGRRQDAAAAIKGDILRALVELITNSDDALETAGRAGTIRVDVDRRRGSRESLVTVTDDAGGMSAEDMAAALLYVGVRASGHEQGHKRRGLFGRGAKDVASLGTTDFASVKNGRVARVILYSNGEADNFHDRAVTDADRTRLRIPDTGTTVKISVNSAFRVPQHLTLVDRISRHVQLRDIMTNDERAIYVRDMRRPDDAPARCAYERPSFAKEVADEVVAVVGYPRAEVRLRLWRLEERMPDDRTPWRQGGIVVKGRHALYEATYFGLEGRSGALWYEGRLDCSYIDDLADEFDDQEQRPSGANPMPVISIQREGLERQHPFVKSLATAIEARLLPFVAAEEGREADAAGVTTEQTQRRLRDAERRLADVFSRLAEELEIPLTQSEPTSGSLTPVPLEIIPKERHLRAERRMHPVTALLARTV